MEILSIKSEEKKFTLNDLLLAFKAGGRFETSCIDAELSKEDDELEKAPDAPDFPEWLLDDYKITITS